MALHDTQRQAFIAEEVSKVKGIACPVHASQLERLFVRKVKCTDLHPNPYDEFCFPEIGPNEEVLDRYKADFRKFRNDLSTAMYTGSKILEPLDVQKIHTGGYMILNGHHRWLAAIRAGIKWLPVRIVNLTQEKDIQKMLQHSKNDKRVTLDLEEIVFSADNDGKTEKPLSFPYNRIYKECPRLGIPALFAFFQSKGYDAWLYSSGYESFDYVRRLLKHYHAQVTGIVTGTARKAPKDTKAREELEQRMSKKYTKTIHADNHAILVIDSGNGEFRELPLPGKAAWAVEVMEVMNGVEKDG